MWGKRIIFGLFFLVFSSAMLLQLIGYNTFGLFGDFSLPGKPEYTQEGFLKAEYQDAYAEYIRTHNPIYNELIRINNQYRFTVFGELPNGGAIEVKDRILMDKGRIQTVLGQDAITQTDWDYYMPMLDFVADTLKKLHKPLLYVIAGEKPHIYFDALPDTMQQKQKTATSYKWYVDHLKNDDRLGFIDMAAYYLKIKDTCKIALYPKYSVHWSIYSVYLATDSIAETANRYLPNYEAALPKLKGYEVTKDKRMLEYEMLDFLNMYWSYPKTENSYPLLDFKKTTTKKKPRVMVIGDSFGQMLADLGYLYEAFDDSSVFLRYNAEFRRKGDTKLTNANKLNYWDEFDKADMVIIISSELNLTNFSLGFTEKAYDHFRGVNGFFTNYHTQNVSRTIEGDEYVYTLRKGSQSSTFLKNTNAPVEEGKKYRLSFMCKGKGKLITDFYPDYLPEHAFDTDSDDWKTYTWEFNMGWCPPTVLFRVFTPGGYTLSNDIQLRSFKLEEVK